MTNAVEFRPYPPTDPPTDHPVPIVYRGRVEEGRIHDYQQPHGYAVYPAVDINGGRVLVNTESLEDFACLFNGIDAEQLTGRSKAAMPRTWCAISAVMLRGAGMSPPEAAQVLSVSRSGIDKYSSLLKSRLGATDDVETISDMFRRGYLATNYYAETPGKLSPGQRRMLQSIRSGISYQRAAARDSQGNVHRSQADYLDVYSKLAGRGWLKIGASSQYEAAFRLQMLPPNRFD